MEGGPDFLHPSFELIEFRDHLNECVHFLSGESNKLIFASAQLEGNLERMSMLSELFGLIGSDGEIMLADLVGDLERFHLGLLGGGTIFVLVLLLTEEVLAVVHHLGDDNSITLPYFYQIELSLGSEGKSLVPRKCPVLLPFLPDHGDLSGGNRLVEPLVLRHLCRLRYGFELLRELGLSAASVVRVDDILLDQAINDAVELGQKNIPLIAGNGGSDRLLERTTSLAVKSEEVLVARVLALGLSIRLLGSDGIRHTKKICKWEK